VIITVNSLIDKNNKFGAGIYQFDADAFVSLETRETMKTEFGPLDHWGVSCDLMEYNISIKFRKEYTEDDIELRFANDADRNAMVTDFTTGLQNYIDATLYRQDNKFYVK